MATGQKLESLKSHGIDIDQGFICFMCLGRHMCPACPHYGKDVDYTDLCIKAISGSKYAFGFHPRAACTHGDNVKFGRKLPGRNVDSKSNHQQAPQSAKNSNWKTYKK